MIALLDNPSILLNLHTATMCRHCEYLAADAKADEADEAHVSDMPGKADVVGVAI
jgi:hypothetical protein